MKLASLRDGSRDGRLVVVDRDVTRCSDAHHVAPTLQRALDGWDRLAPHLDLIARGIDSGGQPLDRFHEREAMAPLPRTYQWIAAEPAGLRQLASDRFIEPRATLDFGGLAATPSLEFGIAVLLGDVPRGADATAAAAAIRLVLLFARLRDAGAELGASLSPVAVTPAALGPLWQDGRLTARLLFDRNGQPEVRSVGTIDFGALVAEAAWSRPLAAGSLLSAPSAGTPVLVEAGDQLRLEMRDDAGHSIFGAIELLHARFH